MNRFISAALLAASILFSSFSANAAIQTVDKIRFADGSTDTYLDLFMFPAEGSGFQLTYDDTLAGEIIDFSFVQAAVFFDSVGLVNLSNSFKYFEVELTVSFGDVVGINVFDADLSDSIDNAFCDFGGCSAAYNAGDQNLVGYNFATITNAPASAVPLPAGAWLFLSALGGLAGIRYKSK